MLEPASMPISSEGNSREGGKMGHEHQRGHAGEVLRDWGKDFSTDFE